MFRSHHEKSHSPVYASRSISSSSIHSGKSSQYLAESLKLAESVVDSKHAIPFPNLPLALSPSNSSSIIAGSSPISLSEYSWLIPPKFNIGTACLDKHCVESGSAFSVALIQLLEPPTGDGTAKQRAFLYAEMKALSNMLANGLVEGNWMDMDSQGRRAPVAIHLPQSYLTALSHLTAHRLNHPSLPLSPLFSSSAVTYRMAKAGACVMVTDVDGLEKVRNAVAEARDAGAPNPLPTLRLVLLARDESSDPVLESPGPHFPVTEPITGDVPLDLTRDSDPFTVLDVYQFVGNSSGKPFIPCESSAEDPAIIIFTSGTTGPAKGAVHAHRVLLGHLPGVSFPQDMMPQPGDVFWTPADWSWIGGLLDVLLPAFYFRIPVIAYRSKKFDAEEALAVIKEFKVTNGFLPPTVLKLLRARYPTPETPGVPLVRMRAIGSGGEPVGKEVVEWSEGVLGCAVYEFYGQTECNLVIGNGGSLPTARPGWTGTAIPGHVVEVVNILNEVDELGQSRDGEGKKCKIAPPGVEGQIAVRWPDPVMFLGYLNDPVATERKFAISEDGHRWLLTGDLGVKGNGADSGYFKFASRDDDVITYAGYRIGPTPLETALHAHPLVHLSAIVGVADPLQIRTEHADSQLIKACVVLRPGCEGEATEKTAKELAKWVVERCAAYERPRIVEFRTGVPTTTTGKVLRRALRDSGTVYIAEMARLGKTTMTGGEIGDPDVILVWAEDGAPRMNVTAALARASTAPPILNSLTTAVSTSHNPSLSDTDQTQSDDDDDEAETDISDENGSESAFSDSFDTDDQVEDADTSAYRGGPRSDGDDIGDQGGHTSSIGHVHSYGNGHAVTGGNLWRTRTPVPIVVRHPTPGTLLQNTTKRATEGDSGFLSPSSPSIQPVVSVTVTPPSTTETYARPITSLTDSQRAHASRTPSTPFSSTVFQQPSVILTSEPTSATRPITTIPEGSREDMGESLAEFPGRMRVGSSSSSSQLLKKLQPEIQLQRSPVNLPVPSPPLTVLPEAAQSKIARFSLADIARSFLLVSLNPTFTFQSFVVLFVLSVARNVTEGMGRSSNNDDGDNNEQERQSWHKHPSTPVFSPMLLLATIPQPLHAKYAAIYRALATTSRHPNAPPPAIVPFPSFPIPSVTDDEPFPEWLAQSVLLTRDRLVGVPSNSGLPPPTDLDLLRAALEDQIQHDVTEIHFAELPPRGLIALDLSRALPNFRPVMQINIESGVYFFGAPSVQLIREACNLLRVVVGGSDNMVVIAGENGVWDMKERRDGMTDMAKNMEQAVETYRARIAGLESSLSSTLARTASLATSFGSLQTLSLTLAEQLASARAQNSELGRRVAELERGTQTMAAKVTKLKSVLQDGVETWVARGEEALSLQEGQNFPRPYFITFFNTSTFTLYLLPVAWREARRQAREKRIALDHSEGSRDIPTATTAETGGWRSILRAFHQNDGEQGWRAQFEWQNATDTLAAERLRGADDHLTAGPASVPSPLGERREQRSVFEDSKFVPDVSDQNGSAIEVTIDYPSHEPHGIGGSEEVELVEKQSLRKVALLALYFCLFWFAANYFQTVSLGLTSVSSSTILSSVSGLFTLVIGTFVRIETFTPLKFLAVVAAFVGVVLISRDDESQVPTREGDSGQPFRVSILGDFLALLGAFFYGVYSVMLKVFIPDSKSVSPTTFLGFVGLWNLVLLWPGFFILNALGVENLDFPSDSEGLSTFYVSLVLNALIGTFLSDYLWLIAVLLTSPVVVTVGLSLTIPLAMIGEWYIDGISVKVLHVLGGTLVVAGFVGVTVTSEEHSHLSSTVLPPSGSEDEPDTWVQWFLKPMFTGTTRQGGWRQLSTVELHEDHEEDMLSALTGSRRTTSDRPDVGEGVAPNTGLQPNSVSAQSLNRTRAESGVSLHTIS
ncbi:hypothetical protein HDU93_005871 [Gonapodya sp. JEL0774]|nr:hypothetical protein HDU93_005871 [Gonapodya sp. JEL0774]